MVEEDNANVEGLNLDTLLNSYKVDLTKDNPSLQPLVVLSDDEDINDYMENLNEDETEASKSQIEASKIPEMMDTGDNLKDELTEDQGKASGIILPLMMVLSFTILF